VKGRGSQKHELSYISLPFLLTSHRCMARLGCWSF